MSSKKRILAVDDENDILLILKTALLSEGFDVTTVASGPEALTAMADETPDLVIVDMMMPEMTGFEVLAQMRQSASLTAVPVIMLTGTTDKEKIREAIDMGVSYYIVKPFEFHDLISKVRLAIADAEQAAF
jgi:DNA-binding response OmpR family regulator